MRNFRKFEIYYLGIEIAKNIYSIIKQFPKSEIYGFSSQLNRASVSIPLNIAERANITAKRTLTVF